MVDALRFFGFIELVARYDGSLLSTSRTVRRDRGTERSKATVRSKAPALDRSNRWKHASDAWHRTMERSEARRYLQARTSSFTQKPVQKPSFGLEMELLEIGRSLKLEAIDDLIRYYRNNEKRMRYQEFLAKDFPIGNGIVESAHRHVLQNRMKLAGQHWSIDRARSLVRLRAAYRTCGPANFYRAIRRAHRRSKWDRKDVRPFTRQALFG